MQDGDQKEVLRLRTIFLNQIMIYCLFFSCHIIPTEDITSHTAVNCLTPLQHLDSAWQFSFHHQTLQACIPPEKIKQQCHFISI